ncbi:MAG: YybH family protein [Gemmataceae bacterium]
MSADLGRCRFAKLWIFPAAVALCLAVTTVSYAVRSLAKPAADGPGHRFTAIGIFSASNHVSFNEQPPAENARTDAAHAVVKLLEAQAVAWNKGDLKGFMDGYWNSPELTFYSGGSIQHGWKETYERYQMRYQAEGREMGQLTVSGLVVEPLSDTTVFVRGHWKLKLKDDEPEGLFTLIVVKKPEGWRIVHDHTSAAEPKKKP